MGIIVQYIKGCMRCINNLMRRKGLQEAGRRYTIDVSCSTLQGGGGREYDKYVNDEQRLLWMCVRPFGRKGKELEVQKGGVARPWLALADDGNVLHDGRHVLVDIVVGVRQVVAVRRRG